jgi:hypothetical protein
MGQTWSVPAVGNVKDDKPGTSDDAETICPLSGEESEWRAFVGSGYGEEATNEGKRFFQLDAITGNVCQSSLVGNGTTTYVADNALVAGPAAFNPSAQRAPTESRQDLEDRVTRIYIPDIHGRIWKFNTASGGLMHSAGPAQPIANNLALLKIGGLPSIFGNSGNDTRVPDAAGPFRMFGFTDTVTDDLNLTTLFTPIGAFPIAFPGPPPSNVLFRGTTQPAVAFNFNGQPRVFFAGTRFNPPTTACLSSFDTIIVAVSGKDGTAVYDMSGDGTADLYTILENNKSPGIAVVGAELVVSESGSLRSAPTPTPDPNPTPTPTPPAPPYVKVNSMTFNSAVCRTP